MTAPAKQAKPMLIKAPAYARLVGVDAASRVADRSARAGGAKGHQHVVNEAGWCGRVGAGAAWPPQKSGQGPMRTAATKPAVIVYVVASRPQLRRIVAGPRCARRPALSRHQRGRVPRLWPHLHRFPHRSGAAHARARCDRVRHTLKISRRYTCTGSWKTASRSSTTPSRWPGNCSTASTSRDRRPRRFGAGDLISDDT